jgi:cellulose synthase/poly-beta-1,6-N-acetylglucosamine synthase-like glycosyltransferase
MMVLFLPIDLSSLRFELYMLLVALVLVLLSWVCLFIKSLHSHLNTPVIKNNSKMVENNKLSFTLPFVSVIVPARNEEDNIEKCLLSILGQKYPNFEVVAVDDNSDDRTLEIMKGLKSRQPKSSRLFLYPLSQMAGWARHGHRSRDI